MYASGVLRPLRSTHNSITPCMGPKQQSAAVAAAAVYRQTAAFAVPSGEHTQPTDKI